MGSVPVACVTDDGVMNAVEVTSKLVGSSGFRSKADKTISRCRVGTYGPGSYECFFALPIGESLLGLIRIQVNQGGVDLSRGREVAPNKGMVGFVDRVTNKLAATIGRCFWGLCKD